MATNGISAAASTSDRGQRPAKRSVGCAQHDRRRQTRPTVCGVEPAEVRDLQQALADGEGEDGEQPGVGARAMSLPASRATMQAAGQRDGQRQHEHRGQPPAAERGLQQQQHADGRGEHERQERHVRGRVSGVAPTISAW